MNATEVLDAVRRKYPRCALVPEVVIDIDNHDALTYWRHLVIREMSAEDQRRTPPKPAQYRRIDALMFDGPQRTAIEVKVSLADMRRESWEKVSPWLNVTHRFVYVVPAGLIDNGHGIPVHCAGLWWVHPDGRIEVRRKAQVRKYPEELPRQVVTALAYRAAGVKLIEGEQ